MKNHILIHDNKIIGWKEWLNDAGIKGIDYSRGPGFSQYTLAIQSAILGDGVALGRYPLVAEALDKKQLVKPFDISLPSGLSYYVVTAEKISEISKISLFTNWLMEEVEKFEQSAV